MRRLSQRVECADLGAGRGQQPLAASMLPSAIASHPLMPARTVRSPAPPAPIFCHLTGIKFGGVRGAAMLRIGPTIYSHTPYARVHNGFLPLFEVPIRCLVRQPTSKVAVFCGVSRRRIAASSDGIMADQSGGFRDQIWPYGEPMLPPFFGAGSNQPTRQGMVELPRSPWTKPSPFAKMRFEGSRFSNRANG